MFDLFTLRDTIEVEPTFLTTAASDSQQNTEEEEARDERATTSSDPKKNVGNFAIVLKHRVEEKFVGRVVPSVGYCVAVAAISSYGDCRVINGSVWSTVTFQAVLFRPAKNERFRATIVGQSPEGIQLSVEFFDAIVVPPQLLPQPSQFDEEEGMWHLTLEAEEESGKMEKHYFKSKDEVIVSTHSVIVGSGEVEDGEQSQQKGGISMQVIGCLAGEGLGPCSWFE